MKTIAVIAVLLGLAGPTQAADLTVAQRTVAEEMRLLLQVRAKLDRIRDMCADVVLDEAKLIAQRDHLISLAMDLFPSRDAFFEAAGLGKQAEMAEDVRRYFLDRGVSWTSPSDDYCTLADGLHTAHAPIAQYFDKR
ncbi:MAG: hypothetical protein AAF919_15985 [Pseudomonadota bacterium]